MLEGLNGQKRHQAHKRSDLERDEAAIRQMQGVVKETVFFIPKAQAATVVTGHGSGDTQEVLKEFTGCILINRIFFWPAQGRF